MTTPVLTQPAVMEFSHATLAERGWKLVSQTLTDGTTKAVPVPLSEAEYLHPEEGFHMPNNTFHQITTDGATDLLTRRYSTDPTVIVLRDVKIEWDNPELLPHVPDVCVVMGIRNKDALRTSFVVADEGVKPCLALEVVSPGYRKADRETKVEEYELAGVQEYIIIDSLTRYGQTTYEILGYRLSRARYRPIVPDDAGRILCRTVSLWLSMRDGQLVMEDAETGERLLTARGWELRAKQEQAAREVAEARAQVAEDEAAQLRARLLALEAKLKQWESGK